MRHSYTPSPPSLSCQISQSSNCQTPLWLIILVQVLCYGSNNMLGTRKQVTVPQDNEWNASKLFFPVHYSCDKMIVFRWNKNTASAMESYPLVWFSHKKSYRKMLPTGKRKKKTIVGMTHWGDISWRERYTTVTGLAMFCPLAHNIVMLVV